MLGLVTLCITFPFTLSSDPARNNIKAKFFKDKISYVLQYFPASEFDSQQRQETSVFSRACRQALGSTQPPIQRVPGYPFLAVKWPGRDADSI
jgi:hypothetical protein